MLPLGKETADVARECGMGLLKIGESGYFKLPEWKPAGNRGKKVRAGVNQARKAGIVVERYDPLSNRDNRIRAEIEELCQAWINTREVDALGWFLELDPFKLAEYKRYFLARAENGHLEGMLACCPIPARNGWYLEDLIRRPGADRGVSELLIAEALKSLAAEGAELATLATSPLAGIEPEEPDVEFKYFARLLRLMYEHLDAFYHFKTLHRFKAKFAPSFVEHDFVAIYPPRIRLRMALGVIGAFDPGGLSGMMASKLRRLWREARQTKSSE
jgi:phosphatidylglycerol lysyltransferase